MAVNELRSVSRQLDDVISELRDRTVDGTIHEISPTSRRQLDNAVGDIEEQVGIVRSQLDVLPELTSRENLMRVAQEAMAAVKSGQTSQPASERASKYTTREEQAAYMAGHFAARVGLAVTPPEEEDT